MPGMVLASTPLSPSPSILSAMTKLAHHNGGHDRKRKSDGPRIALAQFLHFLRRQRAVGRRL